MNWILDHLQLVIAIAGAVAWWLNQKKQAQAGEEAPPPEPRSFEDPQLAERTRRIREEIQRKIEQRAKGYATEQPKAPRPAPDAPPPIVREVVGSQTPAKVGAGMTRTEVQRQAEILGQQAALAERLHEAELMKAMAMKRAQYEAATADHSAATLTQTRTTLLDDLHTPEALRRAFILREVLGPPVALR